MKYPDGIKKKTITKKTNYAKRGMDLEADINLSNDYYRECGIALVYKKPTPIKATKISYNNNSKKINDGFFECASTTDYNGVYKGFYIDFEAKTTTSKTSFPISNIHQHQLKHLQEVLKHRGISFIIIAFVNLGEVYLLESRYIFDIINDRKSIPINYIKEYGFEIKEGLRPRLDYIKIIDQIIGGKNENKIQ